MSAKNRLVDKLVEIRELLTPLDHWTVRAYARNAKDKTVGVFASDAKCFCLAGAIMRCCGAEWELELEVHRALTEVGIPGLERFNDQHSHAEVLGALDRAIEAAVAL